jgi:hypothetical protein
MRNLTTSEILSQIIHAKRVMNDFPTVADIETRKQAIADKRRQMRQKFAQYFGKGKQRQGSNQPSRKELNEEHAVPEEPKRTITNIVFMVRCPADSSCFMCVCVCGVCVPQDVRTHLRRVGAVGAGSRRTILQL